MKVLIVSKTRMTGNRCCIGGLSFEENARGDSRAVKSLRLGKNHDCERTVYEIGQVWEMDFKRRKDIKPPHYEDVIIINKPEKIGRVLSPGKEILSILQGTKSVVPVWHDTPDKLFDGFLQEENGKGFILKSTGIPNQSTGFWISDKDLKKGVEYGKTRYFYPRSNGIKNIAYVGYASADLEIIPAGTLLRVSQARWWDDYNPPRCYLQLSGWYADTIPEGEIPDEEIPF